MAMKAYRRSYQYQEVGSRSCPKESKTRRRSIPEWEKEFCLKVGGIRWKDMLQAKKYMPGTSKVMQWDDSEGKDCFYKAKERFRARKFGCSPYCDISLPSPNMYIDHIDWNPEIDPQLLMELEEARILTEPLGEKESEIISSSAIEHVKPTGWDVCEDWQGPRLLTGMIVGDDGDYMDTTEMETSGGDHSERINLRTSEDRDQGGYIGSSSINMSSRHQGSRTRQGRWMQNYERSQYAYRQITR